MPTNELVTAYYTVNANRQIARTVEVIEGRVMVDVDDGGRVVGIEVLGDHDPVLVYALVLANVTLAGGVMPDAD